MARPKSVTERELIQEQLSEAKMALARLRQRSDSPVRNGEINAEWKSHSSEDANTSVNSSNHFSNGGTRSSSRSDDVTPRSGSRQQPLRISTAARDNLVQALGFQVSQLEDDLKASLLSYFEQVERQKEDLINSFNIMQQQLLRHQQICQEQTQEAAEKDTIVHDLKTSKRQLEEEVERLKAENERYALESSSFLNGLDSSMDSFSDSLNFAPSSVNSGYSSEKSDVSEKLMRENARLRGLLRQQENLDSSRLERRVDLQQKLCHSYDKDLASKDMLIKRLTAENKGLQSDMQSMQDEVLRVNASRLNAEKDKTRLQQEIQFKDEQFMALRGKLAEALEDRDELKNYVSQVGPSANDSDDTNVPGYDAEIAHLRHKCNTYKDKLSDREKFINSMKKDNQDMAKTLETLKKDLTAAKNEAQRMKRENERLQRENADRDIDRLSKESTTKASNSTIARLKNKTSDLEDEIRSLQRKCEEAETREEAQSQTMLANVQQLTHAEQELYETKKELAQLRGFYESTEKRKKELQNEAIAAREKIIRLEKELRLARDSKNLRDNHTDLEELESENRELNGEVSRLGDALSSSRSELNELENAMENSREQISIQKVRLDGNETMIMRKDERIKELQEELVELHNQNDALTDEILRKNREIESIKMGKRLAEQERELLKTGKLPMKSSNKDITSFSSVEPSTPDSGFSETDAPTRGKNIAGNNREAAEESREEDGRPNGKYRNDKETRLMEENIKLKEKEAEMADIINDMKRRLAHSEEECHQMKERETTLQEEFEGKENDLMKALDDVKHEVSDLQDENSKLKEYKKSQGKALENKKVQKEKTLKQEVLLLDQLDALESTPVMDPWEFDPRANEQAIDFFQQEQAQSLKAGANEELLDFSEPPVRASESALQNAPNENITNSDIIKENENLKNEVENYQTQLEDLSNKNQGLEADLEKTRELVKKKQKECEEAKRGKEVQSSLRKETATKEAKIGELQKQLQATNKTCNDLKSQVEKLKANAAENENKLKNVQGKCAELENKGTASKKTLEELLERAKEDEETTRAELGQAKTKIKNLENEIRELQHEETQSGDERRELLRQKRNFEEHLRSLEKEKSKLEKKMKELHNEKDDTSQKWEDAKRSLKENKSEQRKLQEEKEDLEFEMNEMLKQKNREIKNLREDLDNSEQKCEDLKSSWSNYEVMSSDLKGELLKVKEECIDLTNENEKLYDYKKELVKDLEAKEKIVQHLKSENDELQNLINNNENDFEKMRDKVKELQEENDELKEESDELRKKIDHANEEQKEVDNFVQTLQDEKETAENQWQAAQESISDLEKEFEKREAENTLLKEKLNKADRKISELQKREDTAQNEMMEAEKRAKTAERKVKELNSALQKSKEDINYLENKQAKQESTIAELEEDHSKAEEQQKVLQKKLLEATNRLGDLETQDTEHSERQKNNDKRLADLRQYNEELETERDDLEYKVKDLKKKLDKEKKRVDALEDDLAAKKMERDGAVQELGLLKSNLSETENEQNVNLNEKEKLKKDLLESSKKIIDLEVEIESQREQIEELEKLLDQKRATVLDMEDNLKDSTESLARLQTQHEEDARMLKSLKEDNANLEKMLEKQKQLSEGYKNSMAQKEAEIAKLSFNRDDAEDALQLLKKDLARREGVNKANREELEEAEKHLANTTKKLQESKIAYDRLQDENERLQKDLENARKRLADTEGMPIEPNFVSVLEVDPLYSRKSSSSSIGVTSADGRIKTLDDKLTKAQTKVTDLENELSKEIRRHEIDCIKTRPSLPYSGKRTGYYDVSGMNNKYGTRRSDSSDSEFSGSVDDVFSKSRGSSRRRSFDSTEGSLDRGSDFDSKGSDKNIKAMSSNTPQTPNSPVFTFDLPTTSKNQRIGNLESNLTKQPNDSFSETSSRDQEANEDVSFDHSIGNLNELISEFNEAEKQDPLLQKFLLDQSGPDGTSSPRHNDSFDMIQPTYTSKRQNDELFQEPKNVNKASEVIAPPSEQLLDFSSLETASDVTSVTDVTAMSEPIQSQNQSLLDFDPFSNSKEKQIDKDEGKDTKRNSANNVGRNSYDFVNEEPGVFDSNSPRDVTDNYTTPFDIPNWDEESNSSFEGESAPDFLDDTTEMDKPVLILINDKKYSDDSKEGTTGDNSKGKEVDQPEKELKSVPVAEHKIEPKDTFTSESGFDFKENENSKRASGNGEPKPAEKPRFSEIQVNISLEDQESLESSQPSSDKFSQDQGHFVRDFVRLTEKNEKKRGSTERHKPESYKKPQQIERYDPDIPQATQQGRQSHTQQERLHQQTERNSDDEEPVFRRPSDIIKQLEQASFTVGKPGTRPPRPKRALNKFADLQSATTGNDDDVNSENEATTKPEPKPRRSQGTKGVEQGRGQQQPPEPKQRTTLPEKIQSEEDEVVSTNDEEEDRQTAIGRQKIMSLIAAFEGKEV